MEVSKWVIILTFAIGINADGQFVVLHAPSSVQFVGGARIQSTALKNIYLVALGFTTDEATSGSELKLLNPFDTPEAAVAFYVEGIATIGNFSEDAKLYPLNMDSYDLDTFEFVKKRILKLNESKCTLVNINLSSEYDLRMYSDIFGEYAGYNQPKQMLKHLHYTVEDDYRFLRELQAMKAITAAVKSGVVKPDGIVDFYTFRFASLHTLYNRYGQESMHTVEAITLLNQQIRELKDAFMEAYSGNVLFTVVNTDGATVQRKRRQVFPTPLPKTTTTEGTTEGTTEETTTTEVPENDKKNGTIHDVAIINIIFWTCTFFYFTLIAVVYALVTMDPGRDSIVYRMTSSIDRVKME